MLVREQQKEWYGNDHPTANNATIIHFLYLHENGVDIDENCL